jgi:hypothetical protein
MKNFKLEFLCFPGLETRCKLCEELIKDRQEETIVPTLFYGETYQGPVCDMCYRDLPARVRASRLQKFEG